MAARQLLGAHTSRGLTKQYLCHAGANPWAPGYEKLVAAMLGEAEMHGHKDAHAAIWLEAMLPVIQVCWDSFVLHLRQSVIRKTETSRRPQVLEHKDAHAAIWLVAMLSVLQVLRGFLLPNLLH